MATKIWIKIGSGNGFLSDSTKLLTWTIVVFSYDRWGSLYGLFIKSFHYKAYIKHATQFSAAQTSPALRPIATVLLSHRVCSVTKLYPYEDNMGDN